MGYRYAVIGSGRQGTAAAYALACFVAFVILTNTSLYFTIKLVV